MADEPTWNSPPAALLRPGPDFDLATFDRSSTPGFDAGKKAGKALTAHRGELLSELQERLFAHGRTGGERSVLLVLQGLDTSGKGGVVRHVVGMVDPQGVSIRSFGVPTEEELRHNYLWRIRRALPQPGRIGVFDRSHYEDVLVARVDNLVEEEVWRKRYAEINRFERTVIAKGTTIIKVALMVSKQEQGLRLLERLDRPDKHWKFSASDITTRKKWDDYQDAYGEVFARTDTDIAPWHVVPADRKWYARLAVTELLTQALIDLDLSWPRPRWRVETQRTALLRTMDPDSVPSKEERLQTLADTIADEKSFKAAVATVTDDVDHTDDSAGDGDGDGRTSLDADAPEVKDRRKKKSDRKNKGENSDKTDDKSKNKGKKKKKKKKK